MGFVRLWAHPCDKQSVERESRQNSWGVPQCSYCRPQSDITVAPTVPSRPGWGPSRGEERDIRQRPPMLLDGGGVSGIQQLQAKSS